MLILPALHTYLSQLLSPPTIHTALLLTPEGALVSYASRMSADSSSVHGSQYSPSGSVVSVAGGPPHSPSGSAAPSNGSSSASSPQDSKPNSVVASIETGSGHTLPPSSMSSSSQQHEPQQQRTKDEIRMAAGLGAEVWAETREEGGDSGMVESELGRILVVAVDDGEPDGESGEPLLLLAVNGTLEADWEAMRVKARKLAKHLAPSVNKHRGLMGTSAVKNRTQSTATSPGRGTTYR